MKCIFHENSWWWGKTITIITDDGSAMIELQFDNNYPSIAFVKGLSVIESERHNRIGTEMLNKCHEIARKFGYSFLQLSVNKEQDWLVDWYKRFGFQTMMIDDHEYTMLKAIKY